MSPLNERRLRTLIDATTSVFFTAKNDGRMVEPQPSWERFTGQVWPSYRGLGWLTAVHRNDVRLAAGAVERAVDEGGHIPLDVRLWHQDSRSFRYMHGQAVPLCDDNGELVEWVGTLADVHDRIEAQHQQQETASLLDAVLHNSPVGLAFLDPQLRFVLINHALALSSGVPAEEHLGRPLEVVAPTLAQHLGPYLQQVVDRGEAVTGVEVRNVPVLGSSERRDWLVSCYPVPGPDLELLGVGATVVDVTERNALQALVHEVNEREARDRFRSALDAMLDRVVLLSAVRDDHGRISDFKVDFLNRNPHDLGGMRRRGVVGKRLVDAYPALAAGDLMDRYVRVVETREPMSIEESAYEDTVDGRPVRRWFAVQAAPFEDGVIVVAHDLSERRRRQIQLQRTYEQLAAAQRLAHIGIWEVDLRTGIVSFSDELRRIFGVALDAAPNDMLVVIDRYIHPHDRSRVHELFNEAPRTGEPFATDIRIVRPNGEERMVVAFGTTEFVEGLPRRLWGTVQDVTEQRTNEEALREAAVRLERERAVVTRLQEAFLPEAPSLPGVEIAVRYLPAGSEATVGGDWYDVFELDDRRVALAVGDVAGHGLPAASLMAQLRNALRGAAFAGQSPDETLRTLNTMLLRTSPEAMATCLYGVYDQEAAVFEWATAGHPPPVLGEPSMRARILAELPGPPLGFPNAEHHTHLVALPVGATLVLYTDGLVEERTRDIDVGLDALRAIVDGLGHVPLEETCEAVSQAMFAERKRSDDVCLLVARPRKRPLA